MNKYLVLFCMSVFNTAYCQEYLSATVSRISDGDTIITQEHGSIRLQCVDTPELHYRGKAQYCTSKGQNINIGSLAQSYLSTIVKEGDKIELDCKGKSYNRMVCYVYKNGKNINNELILNGYGVASKKYCTQKEIDLWINAKQTKKGLYKVCDFDEPCKFRGSC